MADAEEPSLPEGTRRLWLDSAFGRIGVLHAGQPVAGTLPAVLIHGGGSDNATISWARLIGPLAAGREVFAPDLPGFGASMAANPAGGPVEMAGLVADCLDRLDVGPAAVFGVSMGGDVALNLALAHPERVAALVLVAPGGLVPLLRDRPTQWLAWLAAQLPDALLLPLGRFANRFAGSALKAMVHDVRSLPPQVIAAFLHEARQPRGALGYTRYNQATLGRDGMRNDLSGRVQEIGVPTLIVHGANDPLVDPEGSRRAAQNMPRARLVMVPACGHWAQLEAHERFLAETEAFLAGLDGR